ncbi:tetratricopeptide repeat protein [Geitlerinema splendidum]|nr:tetratricopeptide repeat protein [Geitlerinema splendidum]
MNQQLFQEKFAQLPDRQREVLLRMLSGETDAEIAVALHITESTVRKHIEKICKAWKIQPQPGERSKRTELIQLFLHYQPELVCEQNVVSKKPARTTQSNSEKQVSNPSYFNYFVGREQAIDDLNQLVVQGSKAILIYAPGGVGKTTLAWEYVQKYQPLLELWMAQEVENLTSAASVVEEWLRRHFNEEPGREFGIAKERLRQKLRNSQSTVGVLIDNLETVLDGNGKFCDRHRSEYLELFRILTDPAVNSVTLITSRERLREATISLGNYRLEGLSASAWQTFFTRKNIINEEHYPLLFAMNQAYGGNAKAMEIISSTIQLDYQNDLNAYWQSAQLDLLSEADLQDLIVSQFERLKKINLEAYQLLCRLGCYRYQDNPQIPLSGVLSLLWDVPKSQKLRILNALKDRCLIEFNKNEYWLHPAIKTEAINRLKTSDDWKQAHSIAADFWTDSVQSVEKIEEAIQAFEAYYHALEIKDFENAAQVILYRRKNKWHIAEPLGISFWRVGLLHPMFRAIAQIIDKVENEAILSELNIIFGYLNSLIGDILPAIEYYKSAYQLADRVLQKHSLQSLNINQEIRLKSVKAASLIDLGCAFIDLGEIEQAIEIFQNCQASFERPELHRYVLACWYHLAYLYSLQGLPDRAFQLAQQVDSQLIVTQWSSWSQGYALVLLGLTYANLHYLEESEQMLRRAIAFAEASNYLQIKAKALTGLAMLYSRQEKLEEALNYHQESIALLDKMGANSDLAEAYLQLALTKQKQGEWKESYCHFEQAIELFTRMQAVKQVERVREFMKKSDRA